jgi:hypothetical protein
MDVDFFPSVVCNLLLKSDCSIADQEVFFLLFYLKTLKPRHPIEEL